VASGPGVGPGDGELALDQSGYGEVYRLAQRLAAGAATPYDFARRVERYLGEAPFVYEEDVPQHRLPLVSFLLDDHAGYCQHYSGAMALLLRMGGVPARVSAGFSPGQLDAKRHEYVVRDLDAHSWVEAWFEGVGWVTFDPTPSDAPARNQEAGGALIDQTSVPGGPQPRGSLGADLGPGGEAAPLPAADTGGGGSSTSTALIIIAGAAVLGAAGWALARRRRRWSAVGAPGAPDVAELERALRRTGRPTLLAVERRFAHSPGARAYIGALAARRYGGGGPGPSAADRRALRRTLAAGLGPLGRLRALWALPPRGLH
jgi:LPXTG-motif cell wall-anchored protein